LIFIDFLPNINNIINLLKLANIQYLLTTHRNNQSIYQILTIYKIIKHNQIPKIY